MRRFLKAALSPFGFLFSGLIGLILLLALQALQGQGALAQSRSRITSELSRDGFFAVRIICDTQNGNTIYASGDAMVIDANKDCRK